MSNARLSSVFLRVNILLAAGMMQGAADDMEAASGCVSMSLKPLASEGERGWILPETGSVVRKLSTNSK